MHAATRADIDRWRTAGLFVDDDFERGITPLMRGCRTALGATIIVALALMSLSVVLPSRLESVWRHRVRPPHAGAPVHRSTPRRLRVNV
jgi:hypothetical protein